MTGDREKVGSWTLDGHGLMEEQLIRIYLETRNKTKFKCYTETIQTTQTVNKQYLDGGNCRVMSKILRKFLDNKLSCLLTRDFRQTELPLN